MSNYLRDSSAFEKAISRGAASYRSGELKALVKAVKDYARGKTQAGIANVRDCWNAWREKDPKEFADRGVTLAKDFEQELRADCEWLGVDFDEDEEDDWEPTPIPQARWLANHFCERDCELSRQIVAELYSVEEMVWLLDQEPEEVATLLAEKMQST